VADIFSAVIEKLHDIGAFRFFFPFILTLSIFYGLLRKSQIFGNPDRNVAVNSIVSLVASFMVWSYPIITGVDVEVPLANFFLHGTLITLIFVIGLMIVGLFLPPNLPQQLLDNFFKGNKVGTILAIGIAVAVIVFITSGFIDIIIGPNFSMLPGNVAEGIAVIILLIATVIIITWSSGGEAVEAKKGGS